MIFDLYLSALAQDAQQRAAAYIQGTLNIACPHSRQ
jgi:hypothetical protein